MPTMNMGDSFIYNNPESILSQFILIVSVSSDPPMSFVTSHLTILSWRPRSMEGTVRAVPWVSGTISPFRNHLTMNDECVAYQISIKSNKLYRYTKIIIKKSVFAFGCMVSL